MPAARGFCEHGKVWTTCQVCGKEVIAAHSAKRGAIDEFGEFHKKKPAKAAEESSEPVEEAADEGES